MRSWVSSQQCVHSIGSAWRDDTSGCSQPAPSTAPSPGLLPASTSSVDIPLHTSTGTLARVSPPPHLRTEHLSLHTSVAPAGSESCLRYNVDLAAAVLSAHKEYVAGQQVYDSYGPNLSPGDLLLDYGFVDEGNRNYRWVVLGVLCVAGVVCA